MRLVRWASLFRPGAARPPTPKIFAVMAVFLPKWGQQQINVWMAGEMRSTAQRAPTPAGTATARYIEWQNAKYGKISVQDFAKLHLIHTPYGKVCAAMVTPGKANDSPYLREMIEMMPDGSGDVLGSCAGGSPRSI